MRNKQEQLMAKAAYICGYLEAMAVCDRSQVLEFERELEALYNKMEEAEEVEENQDD